MPSQAGPGTVAMAITATLAILPFIAIALLNIAMTIRGYPRLSQVIENYMARYPIIAAGLGGFVGALAGHIFWATGPNPPKDFAQLRLLPIAFVIAMVVGAVGAGALALIAASLRPLACPSPGAILMNPPQRLGVNEQRTVRVRAHCFWNDSGLEVTKGEAYSVTASGAWWDLLFCSGATGYTAPGWSVFQKLLQSYRRLPKGRWFVLGAQVLGDDQQSTPAEVGASLPIVADGRLTFFANDVKGFYWNNWGSLSVTIRRLPDQSMPAIQSINNSNEVVLEAINQELNPYL